MALKPGGDITRSPKQGYQWPHKGTCVHQKLKIKFIAHVLLYQNNLMVFQYGKSKGQNVSGIVKEEMFFSGNNDIKNGN